MTADPRSLLLIGLSLPTRVASALPGVEPDRRGARRYLAEAGDAWLNWQEPETGAGRSAATLILDFSQSGALIVVDEVLPPSSHAWLALDRPAAPVGVEVFPVAATLTRSGPHLLRVAFVTRCPDAMFKAVVLGTRPERVGRIDRRLNRPLESFDRIAASLPGWDLSAPGDQAIRDDSMLYA